MIILSTIYLYRDVKYAEHSCTGHACALYGRMIDNYKNLSNILSGLSFMSIPFYLSFLAWFLKYDDTYLELSMNCLLSLVRHSTSFTYVETHPTWICLQMNIRSWLLMWNLAMCLCLGQELLVFSQTLQWKLLDYPKIPIDLNNQF